MKNEQHIAYKLLTQDMRSVCGNLPQWKINKTVSLPQDKPLKLHSYGIHVYCNPILGLIRNCQNTNIVSPRIFKCLVDSKVPVNVTNSVHYNCTLIEELPKIEITLNNKIAFAIYSALVVFSDKQFLKWAEDWLSNKDRTYITAAAAYVAAAYAAPAYVAHAATYATITVDNDAYIAANIIIVNNAINVAITYAADAAIDAPKLNFNEIAEKAMLIS